MHKVSKRILIMDVVLCLLATSFIGCGKSQEAASAPGANQAAPAAEPIVLRVAHHEPVTSPFHKAWEEFGKQLEAKTNGAAKLVLYPSEQLGKGADMVTMVVNNVTDIGWIVAAFFPGQFPITEVINLPMMGIPSARVGAKSLWDLYQNNPEMQKEWAQGMHLITFSASGYQFLNTKTKKLVAPEDIKGLKIRAAGANPSKFIEMLGGSPVSMPPPDMYEALDKGVIDGFCLDWMGINSFKLQDVTKYSMAMPFVSVPHGIVINQKVWDKLPDNVKAVFNELGGATGTQLFGAAFDQIVEPVSAKFLKLEGREITQVTDEQKAAWDAAVKPMWDGWVKTMDEKGFKGQAIIDEFRGYVAENSKSIK